MPRGRIAPPGTKDSIKKGTAKRLIKFIFGTYTLQYAIIVLCILINAFASIISTIFMQRLIDNVIVPGISTDFSAVSHDFLVIILTMGFVFIMGIVGSLIQRLVMAHVTQDCLHRLRTTMFNKMQTLPIKYFDTHAHGNIMSTYTNDTDALRELVGQSIPQVMQSLLSLISVFVIMLSYSIWLTLAEVAFIFLIVKVSSKLGKNSAKYMVAHQQSLAAEEGFIEEMMEGQKVIKVFCHQQQSKEEFDKLNDQLFENNNKAHVYSNIMGPVSNNMGNLLYVFIAILGSILVFLGVKNFSLSGMSTITIGIIVSFLSMSRSASQTIGQITQQIGMITMGLAGASRIFELSDQESEEDNGFVKLVNVNVDENSNFTESEVPTGKWAWKDTSKSGNEAYTLLSGDVIIKDVNFGYTDDSDVLHNVSLWAKSGEKIAFVGATGAGKTTITNLINRFYDIKDGLITYDGIDIKNICKPDLRRSLGVVLQDVNLFTGTVLDNIRYGRLDATDEECIQAAKLANADSFITRLPEGYNTILTANGSNLSQGQRQLISIARAAVANPPVMILDEATSSIDTRTESLVQQGMDNLMAGRTVFVIAHRLSTVRNSKAIIVLDHGKIIERGDHQTLLDQKGTYWQLYTGAFELE